MSDLDYNRRLDQLAEQGDEDTLAAVVIARALHVRVQELEDDVRRMRAVLDGKYGELSRQTPADTD